MESWYDYMSLSLFLYELSVLKLYLIWKAYGSFLGDLGPVTLSQWEVPLRVIVRIKCMGIEWYGSHFESPSIRKTGWIQNNRCGMILGVFWSSELALASTRRPALRSSLIELSCKSSAVNSCLHICLERMQIWPLTHFYVLFCFWLHVIPIYILLFLIKILSVLSVHSLTVSMASYKCFENWASKNGLLKISACSDDCNVSSLPHLTSRYLKNFCWMLTGV